MWISGGQHFSFGNQPVAMGENFKMFMRSLEPLMDSGGGKDGSLAELRSIVSGYQKAADEALNRMWARKLGLRVLTSSSSSSAAEEDGDDATAALLAAKTMWERLQPLLLRTPTDWTIFWRQLCEVPAAANESDETILQLLSPSFYKPLEGEAKRNEWIGWVRSWLDALRAAHGGGMDGVVIGDAMRLSNPKYIPREWMLAFAYEAAEKGDYEPVKELHQVLTRPYDEQPMFEERFYKRAPHGAEQQGGIGFMS